MVTLNFTLVVQLALFLAFLWAIDRFIFRKLLALLDQRQDQIEQDKQDSVTLAQRSEELEQEYAAKLAQAHRAANKRLQHELYLVSEQNLREITALRAEGEQEIDALRKEYKEKIRVEKDKFPALAHEIEEQMARKLGFGQES